MDSLDRRFSMQLPIQFNSRMRGPFHQNNGSLPPLVQAEGDTLLSRDMDPKNSNMRRAMRKHIFDYVNKKPRFREWGKKTRGKLAVYFDDTLYTRAETKMDYFDLKTLESRLDDLISSIEKTDTRKEVALDAYAGLSEWSSEIPPNNEVHPTGPFLYNDSIPTTSCDDVSSIMDWAPLLKTATSLLSNGSSTSHGNEHQRAVANLSIESDGTVVHCQEDVQELNMQLPMSGRHLNGIGFFNAATAMPQKQYTESQGSHVLQNKFYNGQSSTLPIPYHGSITNAVQYIGGEKASEGCMFPDHYGDQHLVPDNTYSAELSSGYAPSFCSAKASTNMNPSQFFSHFTLKSTGVHPRPSQQTEHQSMQVTECLVQSPPMDPRVPYSEKGHLSHPRQVMGEFHPSFSPCKQFDQLQQEQVLHEPHAVRDAIQSQTSLEGYRSDGSVASCGAVDACRSGKIGGVQYRNQHLILSLYHAMNCLHQGTKCKYPNCMRIKQKLSHIYSCNNTHCANNCVKYRRLLQHLKECNNNSCTVCAPVRMKSENLYEGAPNSILHASSSATQSVNTLGCSQPPLKCMKKMNYSPSGSSQSETSQVSQLAIDHTYPSSQGLHHVCKEVSTPQYALTEAMKLVTIPSASSSKGSHVGANVQDSDIVIKPPLAVEPLKSEEIITQCKQVKERVKTGTGEVKMEVISKTSTSFAVNQMGTMLGKSKIKGLSLIDSFTSDEVREHIRSLMQCNDQKNAVAEGKYGMECLTDANKCSLCGVEKLLFEAPSRYCRSCSKQINPKGVFYSMKGVCTATTGGDAQNSFCSKCYNVSGDSIKVGGEDIPKANLERRWDYAATDAEAEWWVQCDKCQSWQHQICALFNGKRNEAMQAEYSCPNCFLDDIKTGVCKPLPQSKALAAKNLPTTMLSDYIEQWLFRRLEQERQERASALHKNFHEVPGADGLVIRVVSSVEKRAEVKQHFLELFQDENYPAEFPYKSKAILLFQKIDGADVCLFGMYVQEYGSECAFPNQRHVCISYIDSVKYFRPEIKTMAGEALRTFVYHEILISYLDYCKKRGFASCYIWSCPSLKQDDYILYSHPTMQKMPKSDKLREWYQMLIQKAAKQKIVVENTNLYDLFFKPSSDCKPRITASRLPYFDGDYWPGEAERLLQIGDENSSQKKGGKAAIGRVLRAAKRDALTGNPKDILLMHQIGEIIRAIKEDFIIIQLHHACKHCCQPIVSGSRWVCDVRKNFHLCDKCYYTEQNMEKKGNIGINAKERYSYHKVEVGSVPRDTDDNDEIVESEFFDTRLLFLSLCQNNHYQFDTLRRAKHSTMMILHHLHNPVATSFISSCSVCHNDIDTPQGWYCKTCPDYSVCDSCYQRNGAAQHCHELVSDAMVAGCDLVPHRRSLRTGSFKQTLLDILVHSSKCYVSCCNYAFCNKLKRFFHHVGKCQIRDKGGCLHCKKIWCILSTHARSCREVQCRVPRCMDLKNHMKKMQMLSDARRRAGVEERIRQQESESL